MIDEPQADIAEPEIEDGDTAGIDVPVTTSLKIQEAILEHFNRWSSINVPNEDQDVDERQADLRKFLQQQLGQQGANLRFVLNWLGAEIKRLEDILYEMRGIDFHTYSDGRTKTLSNFKHIDPKVENGEAKIRLTISKINYLDAVLSITRNLFPHNLDTDKSSKVINIKRLADEVGTLIVKTVGNYDIGTVLNSLPRELTVPEFANLLEMVGKKYLAFIDFGVGDGAGESKPNTYEDQAKSIRHIFEEIQRGKLFYGMKFTRDDGVSEKEYIFGEQRCNFKTFTDVTGIIIYLGKLGITGKRGIRGYLERILKSQLKPKVV